MNTHTPWKTTKALDLSPHLFLSQVILLALRLFAPTSPNKQALCLWTLPLLLCPSTAAWYGCSRVCVFLSSQCTRLCLTPCLFTLVYWQRESGFWLSSCANVKQKLNWSEQWRDWVTERLGGTIGGRRGGGWRGGRWNVGPRVRQAGSSQTPRRSVRQRRRRVTTVRMSVCAADLQSDRLQ